jgi:hypothetical protein
MPNYKATKRNQFKIYAAIDLQEAEEIAATFGPGWVVAPTTEPLPQVSEEEIVESNISFGNQLVNLFMVDNAKIGIIPELESLALLAKFQQILPLAQLGSIKVVGDLLPSISIDAYFTQERKDKYQTLINDYLAQF